MSFIRPTLGELVDRIGSDFVGKLEGISAILRRSTVSVLARVMAGASHMQHGHIAFLGRQIFPDQSEDAFLVRQASLFGISKNPPTFGHYTMQIAGAPDDTTAPAGSRLTNAGGFEFSSDADGVIAAGVATVAVTALVAGADSNLIVGDTLTFSSPISGINATATVTAVGIDGEDQETTEELRVRVLARYADPPHGGNDADFIEWVKQAGVGATRAWIVDRGGGPGTVWIRFVCDNQVGSIIPAGGLVTTVQNYIDQPDIKPAYATVLVIAPTASPLALIFSSITPNTQAVKDAITAQFKDFMQRVSEPGSTTLLSELRTAIGSAAGLTDYTLTSPAVDTTHTANQIATAGNITFP